MAVNPVVLILGAGPRIGTAVAEKFASTGYSVAVTSRNGTGTRNDKGYLSLKADFAKPDSIPALFDAVQNEFKTAPNVVVYNAATLTNPPEKDSVLSLPAEALKLDMNVNTISPYIAAQEAVKAWESLAKDVKKTFIYTGNRSNVAIAPIPMVLTLGMGKSASAYFVGTADTLYSDKGYRFFYADERTAEGANKGFEIDGPAHGEFFAQLADHVGSVPWHATFVKDKGYVQFQKHTPS